MLLARLMRGGLMVALSGVVSSKLFTYSNMAQRAAIAKLCKTEEFSNIVLKLDEKCPLGVNKTLQKNGVSCNLNRLEVGTDNSLAKFQKEAGENVRIFKDSITKERYIEIDLRQIIERYTGYDGRIIWESMYRISQKESLMTQLLSGVHCSISIHLCAFYNENPAGRPLYMNHELMRERVTPSHVKNLLFTLDFLLSLLPIATNLAKSEGYGDDCNKMLKEVKGTIPPIAYDYQIYGSTKSLVTICDLWIEVMSCVECLRCKVWGKVQFEGMRCAILLVKHALGEKVVIGHQDLVCYVNLINRLSTGVSLYRQFLVESEFQTQANPSTCGEVSGSSCKQLPIPGSCQSTW
ncbi:ERO1-like protein alpha [Nematocida displodere]|uniref:ERO1-like protein alpha n=1 Tax=Nematocida displodere TaxID=1805483 RepID=A0A177EAQ0_9MICR|nr:ERO1-like protein alpha [Nematocida displodere]